MLYVLAMSFNHISSLDNDTFSENPELGLLYLADNQIEVIHSSLFKNVENLRLLEVSNNIINRIERNTLTAWPKMQYLTLSNNTCIDESFSTYQIEAFTAKFETCFFNYDGEEAPTTLGASSLFTSVLLNVTLLLTLFIFMVANFCY